ncbi:RPII140-upstream gene protein-like [Physella acuta]|uniref:RPII140-upstream gene protein-like n=1 Tax=Physella acuta TaxID=109671 RepID=UPI0027DE0741|nr:RPII140-upstream gene protein-like [Physella acuta]
MSEDKKPVTSAELYQALITSCKCNKNFIFPFESYQANKWRPENIFQNCFKHYSTFTKIFRCSRVYASDGKRVETPTPEKKELFDLDSSAKEFSPEIEAMARIYIDQETGYDRVKSMFKNDLRGQPSIEVRFISITLMQIFVVTFLMKYVPEWKLSKEEFIRQHRGTVFRTRLQAIRMMQDQISFNAILKGIQFSTRMAIFSASFLYVSQCIASYRNKTSVMEYSIAGGLTGGLARFHLGLKGFVSGFCVAGFLGSLVGAVTYAVLNSTGFDQASRHLLDTMSNIENERVLIGETAFLEKMARLVQSKPQESSV